MIEISKMRIAGFLTLAMALAHVGCSSSKSSTEKSASDVKEPDVSAVAAPAFDGVKFSGNGVIRTQYINNGQVPVMIEAVVSASAPRGEQSIVSNCQFGGFSLSLIDNYWTLYWHDSNKYQTVRAKLPVKIGQRTKLLGIIEEGKMEFFVDGVSQGTTPISEHKPRSASQHSALLRTRTRRYHRRLSSHSSRRQQRARVYAWMADLLVT